MLNFGLAGFVFISGLGLVLAGYDLPERRLTATFSGIAAPNNISNRGLVAYLATSPLNDAPCTSNVVNDYGADPSGTVDSTYAFQSAVNAIPSPHAAVGNIICVPPGLYSIGSPGPLHASAPHDIEILRPSSENGGALIGPTHGVAQIVQRDLTSYILSSCLTKTSSGPHMPPPSGCGPADANSVINNWRIQNLALTYASQVPAPTPGATSGSVNGWGPGAIYFPKVSGLEMHNVVITNAWNCYDLGSEVPSSIQLVRIVESTGTSTCAGGFIVLHGTGGGLSVVRQSVQGGGIGNPFEGVMYDTSDAGYPQDVVSTAPPSLILTTTASWRTIGKAPLGEPSVC